MELLSIKKKTVSTGVNTAIQGASDKVYCINNNFSCFAITPCEK